MNSHACRIPILGLLVTAALAMPAQAHEDDGFLYGRVIAESGTEYEGRLRWGDEEAFWDDLFNSSKSELPWQEMAEDEREDRDRGRSIEILGYRIRIDGDWDGAARQFICRFGDIERIEVRDDDEATVYTKNGGVHEVAGYSNDVSGTIHVHDAKVGEIGLKWEKVREIQFLPTPRGAGGGLSRLHGTVETDAGTFTGFVQWDKQECLSTDLLDGESEDGEVSLEMGKLRSIERRGRRSSRVELDDGRKLRLRGSNDVDSDNRGILVEDPRYGRVEVPWEEFERVVFDRPQGSGRAYGEYRGERPLEGTVRARSGEELRGRIAFDLDESAGWEMLNGERDGIGYSIPFERVARIEPDRNRSLVTLVSGEEIELEDSQDVGEANDGLVVVQGDSHRYIPWSDVEWIRFGDAR